MPFTLAGPNRQEGRSGRPDKSLAGAWALVDASTVKGEHWTEGRPRSEAFHVMMTLWVTRRRQSAEIKIREGHVV